MITKIMQSLFGNKQARDMRRLLPLVRKTNDFYGKLHDLSDEELRGKT